MARLSSDPQRYALIGAQSRLDTLQAEVSTLLRSFPELGRGSAPPVTSDRRSSNGHAAPKRNRRKMTDAQKRAVGERMTKYWAKRRKEKATKAASSGASKAAKPAANA